MEIFVVHKSDEVNAAKKELREFKNDIGIPFKFIFLKQNTWTDWKTQAKKKLNACEIVILFNSESAISSVNVSWELEEAISYGKTVLNWEPGQRNENTKELLVKKFHFRGEFENCFKPINDNDEQALELYKIMVESSESLVQRRQVVASFYVTLVVGLIAAMGYMLKESLVSTSSMWLLSIPTFLGALLSWSWNNVIDGYGKLNEGKFAVINEIEKSFSIRIFTAEWFALGNGLRPHKYRSFTRTERIVPQVFFFGFLGSSIYFILQNQTLICTFKELKNVFFNLIGLS